ncbi:hypothetical protein Meth11DRAFT_1306 [Methylophilaceae bacterium 11]|uniref:DUF6134 family protein n=1 Tax=unclassified Methylotenera TaxID=2643294 RepID=UPI000377702D|nr:MULTISPECIES: DUF6134 family protein [unclassified Methylotenera]EUJ10484.1 hypothetical protein Meth11DRAFT_1306 [Methylophilaceae bacterium 11]
MQTKSLWMTLALLLNAPAYAKDWSFDVYLDKQKIGTHTFTLDGNQLSSQASFKVKVLFINAYDYQHAAQETWQNDCLTKLKAHTVENKVVMDVDAERKDSVFEVNYNKTKQKLPECTMTFAYWNTKILTQKKLLNPQNAEYLDTNIQSLGNETIQVKGRSIDAKHYKIMGALNGKNKLNIEVWYDQNDDWLALKSITPEGYEINYKLK